MVQYTAQYVFYRNKKHGHTYHAYLVSQIKQSGDIIVQKPIDFILVNHEGDYETIFQHGYNPDEIAFSQRIGTGMELNRNEFKFLEKRFSKKN